MWELVLRLVKQHCRIKIQLKHLRPHAPALRSTEPMSQQEVQAAQALWGHCEKQIFRVQPLVAEAYGVASTSSSLILVGRRGEKRSAQCRCISMQGRICIC